MLARVRRPLRPDPRDFARENRNQSTGAYWVRRRRSRSRRHWVAEQWQHSNAFVAGGGRGLSIMRAAIPSLLAAFGFGGLFLASILALEFYCAHRLAPWLLPSGASPPPLSAFPTLAVQVSASLLGFYLASVSIVLGTSYHNVSGDVRDLILGNVRVRLYLRLIGMSIGGGLALLLLEALSLEFGYLTLAGYAVLVVFGGWAFVQLAFRAFDLFNPIVLAEEPLRALQHSINRLGKRKLIVNDMEMSAVAREADKSLSLLAELIDVTNDRTSVDRSGLASMVERLLCLVRSYARRKHHLPPESAWFIPDLVYPRWIEAGYSEASNALGTSTPLQPTVEPATDWLEKRAATLVVAALGACVDEDNREGALRITRAAALTAQTLAEYSRFDEAVVFSSTVRDFCRTIKSENSSAVALASEPPRFLASLLVGYRVAIARWPDEVRTAVSRTKWDSRRTKVASIVGSVDVGTAAARLLKEVRAEREIEGRRMTPDWYLRLALAEACIFSLRKIADQLPKLVEEFAGLNRPSSSPVVEAMTGVQAMQTLAETELVGGLIPRVAEALEVFRLGNERRGSEEFESLIRRIQSLQLPILERIATAVPDLQPDASSSDPDLFGEAFFRLIHHTEQAISAGNEDVVKRVFPKILPATLTLERYVILTYGSPMYQDSPAIFDPVVGLMELSGLAMVYRELRGDRSNDPVRETWETYIGSLQKPEIAAKWFLDILDVVDRGWPPSMSAQSIARAGWQSRLARKIVDAGWAMPLFVPGIVQPEWDAPPLVKRLGVMGSMPSIVIQPCQVFAAEVIAPLTGESEATLRARPSLEQYFDQKDRYPEPCIHVDADAVDDSESQSGAHS